jgi:hypothetical protein
MLTGSFKDMKAKPANKIKYRLMRTNCALEGFMAKVRAPNEKNGQPRSGRPTMPHFFAKDVSPGLRYA